MLDPHFSYESFVQTSDRERLSRELEQVLTARVQSAAAPAEEGYQIAAELRELGHDLWNFDESTDSQDWCGDWKNRKHPYELIVTISYRDDESPKVSVAFRTLEPT